MSQSPRSETGKEDTSGGFEANIMPHCVAVGNAPCPPLPSASGPRARGLGGGGKGLPHTSFEVGGRSDLRPAAGWPLSSKPGC